MLSFGRMVSLSSGFGVDVTGVLGGLVLRNPFSVLGSTGLALPFFVDHVCLRFGSVSCGALGAAEVTSASSWLTQRVRLRRCPGFRIGLHVSAVSGSCPLGSLQQGSSIEYVAFRSLLGSSFLVGVVWVTMRGSFRIDP